MEYKELRIGKRIAAASKEGGYYAIVEYIDLGATEGVGHNDDFDETWGPFYEEEEESFLKFMNMLADVFHAYPESERTFESYCDIVPSLREWVDTCEENKKYSEKTHCVNGEEVEVPESRLKFHIKKDSNGQERLMTSYRAYYIDEKEKTFFEVQLV